MPGTPRETHESDQHQAEMRNFAASLALDVVMYHRVLEAAKLPDDLAATLTKRFNDAWLASHLEAQATMNVLLPFGDDE